jgi:PAS domain-containing protein
MIDSVLPVCSRGGYLRVIKASILNMKLENKWEAIYQTDSVLSESSNSSWPVSLAAISILRSIEHDILEAELRDGQNTGINVVKTVELQKAVAELHEQIVINTEHVLAFWSMLLSENIPARKFEMKGIKITEVHYQIKLLYEDILKRNSNHLQSLLLYGNYLDSVMNEQEDAERIIAKANSIQASLQTNQMMAKETRMRLFNNVNPCIIIASANRKTMGLVKSANPECAKVLGWSSDELVGKGLETIMPKIYADHHLTYSLLIQLDEATLLRKPTLGHQPGTQGLRADQGRLHHPVQLDHQSGPLHLQRSQRHRRLDGDRR